MMIDNNERENVMSKQVESVAEFLARGGQITMVKPMKARGAQKKVTIKVPYRFKGLVK